LARKIIFYIHWHISANTTLNTYNWEEEI